MELESTLRLSCWGMRSTVGDVCPVVWSFQPAELARLELFSLGLNHFRLACRCTATARSLPSVFRAPPSCNPAWLCQNGLYTQGRFEWRFVKLVFLPVSYSVTASIGPNCRGPGLLQLLGNASPQ